MKPLLPDVQRLQSLREEGMTHKQIAAWILEKQGVEVSPRSISAALSRAGLSPSKARYEKHLPWTVQLEHTQHYAARMLRLMGRRDAGIPLAPGDQQRLDSWLGKLRKEHAIVAYLPDRFPEDGFKYVDGDFDQDGIPVLRPARKAPRRAAAG